MRKVICDFCNKPTNDSYEYTFPMSVPIEAKNKDGVVLARLGYETQDVTKDVCPVCREKISALLPLVSKVHFNYGDSEKTIKMMSIDF